MFCRVAAPPVTVANYWVYSHKRNLAVLPCSGTTSEASEVVLEVRRISLVTVNSVVLHGNRFKIEQLRPYRKMLNQKSPHRVKCRENYFQISAIRTKNKNVFYKFPDGSMKKEKITESVSYLDLPPFWPRWAPFWQETGRTLLRGSGTYSSCLPQEPWRQRARARGLYETVSWLVAEYHRVSWPRCRPYSG
jgi:hypothetical protein